MTAPDGAVVAVVGGAGALWATVVEFPERGAAYRVERIAPDGRGTTIDVRASAAPRLVSQRDGGVLVLGADTQKTWMTTLVEPDGRIRARTTLPVEGLDELRDLQIAPGSGGVGASMLFAEVSKHAPDRTVCRLVTIGADGQLAPDRWNSGEDDAQCYPIGIAARGAETIVVVRNGAGRTTVTALGDSGPPRWTQQVEPSCGVSWLGVAATDDTIAVLSSYTENVPSWRVVDGQPEPVKSIHVHAIDPGTGVVRWEYDVPMRGAFWLGEVRMVAAGRSFVLLARFNSGGGTIHGDAITPDDAYLLALDQTSGAPQWDSVISGDRGGSGYPAITRLGFAGSWGGELIVYGSYRRGIKIGGLTASAPARYDFTDWTGKRHFVEPEVGFFSRLR